MIGLPCDVIDREDESDTYTVKLSEDDLVYVATPDDLDKHPMRHRVPREAIFFVDTPKTTDLHLPNPFRHEIQIPERMMPSAWRNRKSRSASIEGEL